MRKDGQAIGIGAGQQSRIHCTRLAGDKADKWFLRQSPKALNLPFKDDIRKPDRDNTIDVYLSDEYMDVLADGKWEQFFTEKPEPMTREERAEWIKNLDGVTPGSPIKHGLFFVLLDSISITLSISCFLPIIGSNFPSSAFLVKSSPN